MFQRRKKEQSYGTLAASDTPMPPLPIKTPKPYFKSFILILSLLLNLYLLFLLWAPPSTSPLPSPTPLSPTTRRHVLFAVASSSLSWPRRLPYLNLWYSPATTRALAFLDKTPPNSSSSTSPPVIISADTSAFPYSFRSGLRSAIRVARVVKEAVDRNETDVRWFVFGDDDTVFFVDNVVRTLARYDHRRWFYVGSNSESYEQNLNYSFEMAFGGGGFAISSSLARVLATVLDSCLRRYGHLYGSDARIYSCVAELGVGLTHEPGFHQVFQGNELLPDLLSVQRTFVPWRRGSKVDANFMFNTRYYPRDPCKRPSVFFVKSVTSDIKGIWSNYTRHVVGNCFESNAAKLKQIIVFSRKLDLSIEEMNAPRRQCCNVLPTSNDTISLHIRQCEIHELISMQP